MNAATPDWHEFLNQVVQALQARGGAVWMATGDQQRPAAVAGLPPTDVPATDDARRQRQKMIEDVFRTHRTQALELDAAQAAPDVGAAAMIYAALLVNERLLGCLELVQRPRLPQQQLQGQLQFLEQACRWQTLPREEPSNRPAAPERTQPAPQRPPAAPMPAATISAPRAAEPVVESADPPAAAVDWPALLACLNHIHRNRRLKDVAESIANETRLLFGSDRVSVGIPHGRKIKIVAVSGQDRVQHRSSLIQAMAKLARLIVATKEPFRFDGGMGDIPPPLERPLAQFTQLSGARFVLIVPLLTPRSGEPAAPEADDRKSSDRVAQGVLIIEQMGQGQPQPKLVAHVDRLRDQLATAVYHARAYESIFLLPVWVTIGRAWSALRGRRLAWTLILGTALIAAATALFVVPWEYRVEAQGQLMPVEQRDVFAPWDGHVVELLARGGDRVSVDQPLVRLRNDDLAAEQAKLRGELGEKRKLAIALLAQIDDAERNAQREEETRLRGKVAETQIEADGLNERLKILSERIDRLTVRAPISGVVTTFQLEQLLLNRPVQRGDVLLQVMDDRGDWQLELDVAEQRLGHLIAAQRNEEHLPLTFRLLTRPEESHQARLASVGTRSVTSEERGSVIELRAALEPGSIDQPSIGAQVRARIDCGQKPLGYCLFGDVIEFVQKYLWW